MPPNDRDAKTSLLALGSAAVLAVYGAGFVRTQAAADRFEGESRRRRPTAPATTPNIPAPITVAEPAAPVVAEHAVSKAAPVTKVKVEKTSDTTTVATVAEKPTSKTPAPAVADTATRTPADTTPKFADLKDGVYTGWGTSRHGDIEARVEIRAGRIVSASIAQCLTMYSVYWIAALPPQVVKRQSAEVDFVSGATESTNAFYYGVLEALKKAR